MSYAGTTAPEVELEEQPKSAQGEGALLEGITVLDFTNVLSGPFSTYQLGLFGANVIKIEAPERGDLARRLGAAPELNEKGFGASFLAQNSGKRSLAVNLKTPGGLALIKRLVQVSDVVIENFRPGVMDRLGIGWEHLREINPKLIYCSISGYGQTGPLRTAPAYDQIIQGKAGMMSVTGTEESGPLRAGFPVADTLGGMAAAFGVASALVRRERTGVGAYLDVSMLESALTAMGWVVSNKLIAEKDPVQMGNDNFTASPSGTFSTRDGQINIAANEDRQFHALCKAIGRDDLVANEAYADRRARLANRANLSRELNAALGRESTAYWVDVLSAKGVPSGEVATVSEALESEQIKARGFVHEVESPIGRKHSVRVLGSPITVDREPCAPAGKSPALGETTDALLSSLGVLPEQIAELRKEGAI
ncbi:MAG: CaiB/BaiF CoA transferase family protein [Micrococcaceae bacterium]